MDKDTVFVRTSKGEDEMHSRTMNLPGDIKRALLMVDGTATYGEISKRAAPSLRAGLEATLEELERDGYIRDKSKVEATKASVSPKMSMPPRMSMPTRMAVPPKIAKPPRPEPPRPEPVGEEGGDLDFMSAPLQPPSRTTQAEQARDAAEAEERARQEAEAAKLKAQQEAEAMLQRAAQEAARIREEAEREKQRLAAKAKAEAEAQARALVEAKAREIEAARIKAETQARERALIEARARQEIEAARVKAEAEARERALIEAKAREQAESARIRAEAEARGRAEEIARQEIEAARLQALQEAEAVRLRAEQEVAKAREEAAAAMKARQKAEAMLIKSVQSSAQAKELKEIEKPTPSVGPTSRSTSATVLFFDVVGYTKQTVSKQIEIKKQFNELVSSCLKIAAEGDLIILDTGDGAAIGFLHHPEDALEVAMKFREAVIANQHLDYPELKVRMGIHLGPVSISNDMTGRSNMVGDGINDAQRVMGFAGVDQIFISRPYYDFISRLKDEYADMFRYRGVQKDKHGREHPVYEFAAGAAGETGMPRHGGAPAAEVQPNPFASVGEAQPNPFASLGGTQPNPFASLGDAQHGNKAGPFAFDTFQVGGMQAPAGQQKPPQPAQKPGPAAASGAGKTEGFSFDTFNVPAAQPPVGQPKPVEQPRREAPVAPQAASAAAKSAEIQPPSGQAYEPSQEEMRRAAQERMAEEKRMAEEALAAKKQAEAEEKARLEAEQRAAEAARAEMERAAKEAKYTAEAAPAAKPAPVVRAKRKPVSLGRVLGFFAKLGVFLVVLFVAALFLAPYVLPMRDYMPKVEAFMSAKLQQPVHVGRLAVRILPTPRLELGEIYVGKAKQFQATQALVNFALTGVLTDEKPIESIELQGVTVSGPALPSASLWMQQIAADDQYPVARISIAQGTLDADALKFTGVTGTLDFSNTGQFIGANLRSNEGKYSLNIAPGAGSKLKMSVSVHDSALPLLPSWSFEELKAQGELGGTELTISEFSGRILGGMVQGSGSLNWRSGWVAQGTMTAKAVPLQRLNKLLEGNMEASGRFKMSSVDLAGLGDSAVLDGSFKATNGMISGMDIAGTARARSTEHLPGGRSHFDEFSGAVSYADNALHIKQAKITSNAFNALAGLDVQKQHMAGSVAVRLSLEDGARPVELKIDGTTEIPTLRYAP